MGNKNKILLLLIPTLLILAPFPSVSAQGPCGNSYTVRPGDTLSEIAVLCGTTVSDLLELNAGIDDPNRLVAGTRISIPKEEKPADPGVSITPICGPPGSELLAEGHNFPPNVIVEVGISRLDKNPQFSERIRSDDTGFFRLPMKIPNAAVPNETWVVSVLVRSGGFRFEAASNFFHVTGFFGTGATTTYFVQPGDTLRSIAAQFNQTISAIVSANPEITNPSRIHVGQRLTIPGIRSGQPSISISPICGLAGSQVRVVVNDFPPNTLVEIGVGQIGLNPDIQTRLSSGATGSLESQVTIPNSAKPEQLWVVSASTAGSPIIKANSNVFSVIRTVGSRAVTTYIVQPGDMLGDIAARFGTSVSALLAANPEVSNRNAIVVGQRLVIPGQAASISISPSSGLPGTRIQVEVSGFPPNTMLDISLGREPGLKQFVKTLSTNSNGLLLSQVTIPESAGFNERWKVNVTTQTGARIAATSNEFIVARPVQGELPLVTIWPPNGPPGTPLSVVAAGFPPFASVDISLGVHEADFQIMASAITDINGTFYARVIIPQYAGQGEDWLVLVNTRVAPLMEASSSPFSVTR